MQILKATELATKLPFKTIKNGITHKKTFFLFQLDSNKDGKLSFEEFKVLFDRTNKEKRRRSEDIGQV